MGRVPQTHIHFTSSVNHSSAVTHKLKSILKELGFHVWHVFEFLQCYGPVQQLPLLVVGEVGVDELMGIGEEEVLIQLVVELLLGCGLSYDSSGGPVGIHKAPSSVDVDCVPGVLVCSWVEFHARFVVGTFSVATNNSGV